MQSKSPAFETRPFDSAQGKLFDSGQGKLRLGILSFGGANVKGRANLAQKSATSNKIPSQFGPARISSAYAVVHV
jgi:hypothetical protein